MTKRKDRSILLGCVLALLIVAGCSGAGGSDGFLAGGGVGGTGVTVGSVSGFGSVFVNGVEIATTGAVVVVDGSEKGSGDQAVRASLAVGQLVRVEESYASDGTAAADRIVYNEDVIGPVSSVAVVDANIRKLVVMGQTVVVDSQTNFVDTTLTAVAAGHVVEVSGFTDDQGFLQATYLRRRADAYIAGTEVQVRGAASGVDTLAKTFQINQLTVDYAAADVASLPGSVPQAGQLLEVKGILNPAGTLAAAHVKPEDILGLDTADHAEISGFVTGVNANAGFEIGGIAIQTDGATAYKGILPEEIGLGSKLTVKGSLTDRVLLADTVRSTTPVKIESNVELIVAEETSLTLVGLAGLTVNVNELTRVIGAAADFTGIQQGDHVKIFGKSFSSGIATASKIIVQKQAKDTVALRGPVEDVLGAVVTVLGVDIDTAAVPESGLSLEDGSPLTRDQFNDSVSIGDSVNANGTWNEADARVDWQSLELGESQ